MNEGSILWEKDVNLGKALKIIKELDISSEELTPNNQRNDGL